MSGARIATGLERDLAEVLQTLDSRFLVALHHGDVDLITLVRRELMNRGIDGNGRWVGYAEAGQALGI